MNKVGETIQTNSGTCEIIEYFNSQNIVVKF